jgi:2-oxoglutarate dehydrogenase E2 component (dihydrolipoamide succinyltransferase)
MPSNIVVPELGESVVEARVARWLKREGDRVSVGEPLVELETEKVDLEVGASQSGTLSAIARGEGEDVKIGELLGTIADGEQTAPAAGSTASPPAQPAPPSPDAEPASPPVAAAPARVTPTARRLAEEHAVDLARVQGSGVAGRVTRQDVESHLRQPAGEKAPGEEPAAKPRTDRTPEAAPAAAAGERTEERVRLSKRRLTIARRLVEAQRTAAMLTTFNEIDMSAVQDLRRRKKEAFREKYGVGLGLTAFFVKASVAALRAFPKINAEIQGDEMVLKHYYDIGVAVGASGGLVVPVLRDADRQSFAGIERAVKDFARRAEDGSLTLEELRGGTFTITNGGVFGSLMSTPILNPPQVGILGLHKIEDRAVPLNGQVVIRPMMYVALSYDHRLVDGLEAVQFLVRVKDMVEDPLNLLLE